MSADLEQRPSSMEGKLEPNLNSKMVIIDVDLLLKFRNSAIEAADALWAIQHGKQPEKDIITINQEIHNMRPMIDPLINRSGPIIGGKPKTRS